MKKNKGFTLVELLAVIVILAVIALIATPQVLSMIESSRQGAAESSMLSYVDAIEKRIIVLSMNASSIDNYNNKRFIVNGLNIISAKEDTTNNTWVEVQPCLNKSSNAEEAFGAVDKCDASTQKANTAFIKFKIDLKGQQPDTSIANTVLLKNNIVKEAKLKFSKYYVSYFYDNDTGVTTYCSSDSKFAADEAECETMKAAA